jgi:apolipoprotein N-acyltransferase
VKRFQPILLSVLGGTLLWASWPVSPFTFLIFFAFLPFLWFEDRCTNRMQFLCWAYLYLLTWNLLTTWWICNSTLPGGIAAILANSLLMCIPLVGFYNIKKRLGSRTGYAALVVYWLTFEYIHLNWQLSWPWLTLGNIFASSPGWVQWYEYTGTSGGSLWILLVNIFFYLAFFANKSKPLHINKRMALVSAFVLFTPFIISFLVRPTEIPMDDGTPEIVVIQPNIDPYEKFEAGSQEKQLNLLIGLSEKHIDSNTGIVVWPETALNFASGIDEGSLKTNQFLLPVRQFLERHPQVKLFTGIEGYRIFSEQDKTRLSRQIPGTGLYYESYNSGAVMDSSGEAQLYHKSKLVPGVETLPSFLRFNISAMAPM